MKCPSCGSTSGRAYWLDESRTEIIRRCNDCGANALGDKYLGEWAFHSAMGLDLVLDPHSVCSHGNGACDGVVSEEV